MGAKNAVIAGDYEKKYLARGPKGVMIAVSFLKSVTLNKETVADYEVIDESSKTSAASAIGRGLVGSFLLGPVGLLAGLSAKKKNTHVVAVEFKDGKKSLLEMDQKYYKLLMTTLF